MNSARSGSADSSAKTPKQEEARQTIPVLLSASQQRQYDIVVEPGLLEKLGAECLSVLSPDAKVLVLTDEHLAETYLPVALKSLESVGLGAISMVILAGEESKSFSQAESVYTKAVNADLSRHDAILALGGGVIGDLAGFCASTYHRGIRVIQVPTTLVAQVDSAIGGKTAVNLGRVKNIVGTFHQPARVLADTRLLETLPPRELAAGLAEVIKYGLIEISCTGNSGLFEWLISHARQNSLQQHFPEMIQRCCEIKAEVVMRDELETRGLRFFLNLGHTFGHAYETLSAFKLLHGEAVAIGMLKAMELSVLLGLIPEKALQPLKDIYCYTGLGEVIEKAPNFCTEALLKKMRQDKKNRNAAIKLVLPVEALGSVVIRDDIPEDRIHQVLASQSL